MSKKKIEYIKNFVPVDDVLVRVEIFRLGEIVEYENEYYKVKNMDEKNIILFNKDIGTKKIEVLGGELSEIHYYGEKREKRARILNVLLVISFLTFNPVLIIFFIIVVAANSFFSDSND